MCGVVIPKNRTHFHTYDKDAFEPPASFETSHCDGNEYTNSPTTTYYEADCSTAMLGVSKFHTSHSKLCMNQRNVIKL